ncbi:uncharacterized protein LOC135365860 isoform X2 [Ornithodoros turicata]|uniref:uncharacterized protein LOC135365860 isoform X2 n=1 Tax=Ornithodoros turicata TaxID=34597 RepID=UPI003138B51A
MYPNPHQAQVAKIGCSVCIGYLRQGFAAAECDVENTFREAVKACSETFSQESLPGPPPVRRLLSNEDHENYCSGLEHLERCLPEKLEGKGCEAEIRQYFEAAKQKAEERLGTSKCHNSSIAGRMMHPIWLLATLVSVVSTMKIATF